MLVYFKNIYQSFQFKYLVSILIIGPLSRWWSAIEANQTLLETGRISFYYFILTVFISFFTVIFLSLIPKIFVIKELIVLKIISYLLYFLLLCVAFGSFLSGIFSSGSNLSLIYLFTLVLILFSIYLENLSEIKFREKFTNFIFLVSLISVMTPILSITISYLDFEASTNLDETQGKGNVLFLIFDEMSFSYFEENKNGIPDFMVNLNNLSKNSNVYTQTSTTYPFTDLAIPSILTGLTSVEDLANSNAKIDITKSPVVFLKSSHRIYSQLRIFDLCEALDCSTKNSSKNLYSSTFFIWIMDFIAVGGHILPEPLPQFFPTLEGTWRNYWEFNDLCFNCYDYLPTEYPELELTPRSDDGFWFYLHHDETTHSPWNLDGEGKSIQPKSTKHFNKYYFPECINPKKYLCTEDRVFLMREIYKNSLLEADRKIGQFVEFLQNTNQYSETMIIVTSDHGSVIDSEGDGRRPKTLERVRPLAHVPLVVKFPGQTEGSIINEVRSTGQIIASIVNTVSDEKSKTEIADLTDPLPLSSKFVTESGIYSFDVESIFKDSNKPKIVNSNFKIAPWLTSEKLNFDNSQIVIIEGIIGYGHDSSKGPSGTAVLAWFTESLDCSGNIFVQDKLTNNFYETLYDSSKTSGLIWSLVERQSNLKIDNYFLFCSE